MKFSLVATLSLFPSTVASATSHDGPSLQLEALEAVSSFHGLAQRVTEHFQKLRENDRRRLKTSKSVQPQTKKTGNDGLRGNECEARLSSCQTSLSLKTELKAEEPKFLAIQMANECTLSRNEKDSGYQYTIASQSWYKDTWLFSDRPFGLESTETTAQFFETFDQTFYDARPNAAFTFVEQGTNAFAGPLVSVVVEAVEASGDNGYSYLLKQTPQQEETLALDSFFAAGENQALFLDCSVFIDDFSAPDPRYAKGMERALLADCPQLSDIPCGSHSCAWACDISTPSTRHIYNPSYDRYVVFKFNDIIMKIPPRSQNDFEYVDSCSRIALWDGPSGEGLGVYYTQGNYISHDGRTACAAVNDPANGDISIYTGGPWPRCSEHAGNKLPSGYVFGQPVPLDPDAGFTAGLKAARDDGCFTGYHYDCGSSSCGICDVSLPSKRHIYNRSSRKLVFKFNNEIMKIPDGSRNDFLYEHECSRIKFWDGPTGNFIGEWGVRRNYINHDGSTGFIVMNDPAQGDITIIN